jgi:prophage maintenance system killer protein
MILLEDILNLHKFTIERYGGSDGLRDSGLLESAIGDRSNFLMVKIYIHLFLKKNCCFRRKPYYQSSLR